MKREHHLPAHVFTSYEIFVMLALAFLQFTVILDFMIMAPMGAILMPTLSLSPQQFGIAVSAYAFGAAASGVLASGFADKFDRKKFLLAFYSGFLVGTLMCGLVNSYWGLVLARLVTGIFAGVMASTVMAIVTDMFAFAARGRVLGIVQTAFSASQVLGLPLGLELANGWGWHSPFLLIVGIGVVAGFVLVLKLKPIVGHLDNRIDRHPLHHMVTIFTNRRYRFALFATAILAVGGYMLMPFTTAFSVHNLGIDLEHLPLVYVLVGALTIFSGPLIGIASDAFGKFRIFCIGTLITCVTVIIYTNLEETPLLIVVVIIAAMFFGIFSRMVPAGAILSAVPAPEDRGGFMAVSSSMQQLAGGLGATIAGQIVYEGAKHRIENFPILGIVLVSISLISVTLMYFIDRSVMSSLKKAHDKEVPVELQ